MVIKITSVAAAVLLAQAPAAFDVASVKRTAPGARVSEFQMRPGGRLFVLNMSVRDLLRRACDCQITAPGTLGVPPGSPRWCGFNLGPGGLVAKGRTMADLAAALSNLPSVGRAVFDATGRSGRFDFRVEYTPGLTPDAAAGGISIFTAMQEQLGLKLQGDKARVPFVVIDSAAPPTEN